ncbi:MAG: hypothetical protein ACREHG_08425 [Candidatus Saccharimonadales bacterium]
MRNPFAVSLALGIAGYILPAMSGAANLSQRYELALGIYSTARGHTSQLKSYIDVIRIPFDSLKQCQDAGKAAITHFRTSRRSADLTRDLLNYVCQPIKEKRDGD